MSNKIDKLINLLNKKEPCYIFCDNFNCAKELKKYINKEYSTNVKLLNFKLKISIVTNIKTQLLDIFEQWEDFYNNNLTNNNTLYIITGIDKIYKNEIIKFSKNILTNNYLTWYFSYPLQLPIFSLSNYFNLGATYTYSEDFNSQKNIINIFEEVISSILVYNSTS